jgi:hypothetical protein
MPRRLLASLHPEVDSSLLRGLVLVPLRGGKRFYETDQGSLDRLPGWNTAKVGTGSLQGVAVHADDWVLRAGHKPPRTRVLPAASAGLTSPG